MGVDFLTCVICGDNFPDCGEHGSCGNCEDYLCTSCYNQQADKYGFNKDPDVIENYGEKALKECYSCTQSIVRDSEIAVYLIEKYGINKRKLVEEILESRSEDQ